MQLRIALLEDDLTQAELVGSWLKAEGFFCHHFDNAADMMRTATSESFDVFLVDWELPDGSGLDVVKFLRSELNLATPILFTTARDSEADIVQGLDAGADDYLIKPLNRFELLARMRAVLRRTGNQPANSQSIEFEPYVFNTADESIQLHGEPIPLTSKEFQVALFLFSNYGKILSRGHILERIWGVRSDLNTRTVDTHVSTLRQKLNIRPNNGWKLSSIYRHGYRLEKLDAAEKNA
ncbi:MAG: response regulator transcription factor [Gammaproteobacteria bacterium]|nr:response regulator transcription factor [Gammaproteobacteria bacterium]